MPNAISAHLQMPSLVKNFDNDDDDDDDDRVRKSKNFPDSKIIHAKTFRTKRVKRDNFAFATKVRRTREYHVFLANMHNVELDGVGIIWRLSGLSGKFLLSRQLIVQTVWNVLKVPLDFPDSF